MKRIDTHQHMFYPARFGYAWAEAFPPLQRTFSVEQYWEAAEGCGIAGTLHMECDVDAADSNAETRFFLEMAESRPELRMHGVIAALRPEEEGFEARLDSLACPFLKGVRRVFHMGPEGMMADRRLRENIRLLGRRGLPFDICALQRQLGDALDLARSCPETVFVLDHCGIPEMTADRFDDWKSRIEALAALPNVNGKISGIIAYVSCDTSGSMGFSEACPVDAEMLRPYVETVIGAFGWDRVVWGGDWPVCTLTADLAPWVTLLDAILAEESEGRREKLFRRNAELIYGIRID